jgi:hypothetical protein
MILRQSTAVVLAALMATAIMAAAGSALADFMNGANYTKAEPPYQVGYAAGAVDMITNLQASGAISDPPLNADISKIRKCLVDQKIKQAQIAAAYVAYLNAEPKSKSEPSALSVFEALKIACKI